MGILICAATYTNLDVFLFNDCLDPFLRDKIQITLKITIISWNTEYHEHMFNATG